MSSLKRSRYTFKIVSIAVLLIIIVDANAFTRRADIKIYNVDNVELSHSSIEREFVVLTTVCGCFYVLYTNQG